MDYLIKIVKVITERINSLFIFLGSLLVMFLMLGVSFAAFSRYCFGNAQGWIIEMSAFGMLFLGFLGAPEVLRRKGHVNIDIFINMLSQRNRNILALATSFVGMAVSFLLFWFGSGTVFDSFQQKAVTVGMYQIPKYLLLCVIPLGSLLLVIGFLRDMRGHFRLLKNKEESEL
ncbi:MAG: TRAP transporter small permease [Desulfocucumaceae bacterium]